MRRMKLTRLGGRHSLMTAMCMQRQVGIGGKAKWTDTERRATSGSAGVTVGPRVKEILSLVKAASKHMK